MLGVPLAALVFLPSLLLPAPRLKCLCLSFYRASVTCRTQVLKSWKLPRLLSRARTALSLKKRGAAAWAGFSPTVPGKQVGGKKTLAGAEEESGNPGRDSWEIGGGAPRPPTPAPAKAGAVGGPRCK